MPVNQRQDQLITYKTRPCTAETQLSMFIETLITDFRIKGKFDMESSGVYDRAIAIVYEDNFVSIAQFEGEGGLLDG